MAATLASVCSVPLTSVLLLFELTKDYRILLPLMVSVKCQCSLTIFFVSQHINISYFRRVVNKGEYCELKVMYQRKAGFPLVAIVHWKTTVPLWHHNSKQDYRTSMRNAASQLHWCRDHSGSLTSILYHFNLTSYFTTAFYSV